MTQAQESRPSPAAETAPEKRLATHPQDTGHLRTPHLTRAEVLAATPAYALIVKIPTGRVTRRLYLTLDAAAKAAQRAEARGHAASLEFVRLIPTSTLENGGAR